MALRAGIRPARQGDDAALAALDARTWSVLASPSPPPSPGSPFFRAADDPADVLVAEAAGVLAGYVRLAPATPLHSNRHVLEITGLAVHPDHRRRGLARDLLEAAAAEATARGARRLRLRVLAPNTAARALYERCGFRVEGVLREEFELEGRLVDDVLMARALGAGPDGSG